MKKLIIVFSIVLMVVVPAFAAPFLVCDPQAGVTHYVVTGPVWVHSPVTAQPDGSIRMDVGSATNGTTSLTVKACKNDPVWGELCSSTVPFDFARPATPSIPGAVKLQP